MSWTVREKNLIYSFVRHVSILTSGLFLYFFPSCHQFAPHAAFQGPRWHKDGDAPWQATRPNSGDECRRRYFLTPTDFYQPTIWPELLYDVAVSDHGGDGEWADFNNNKKKKEPPIILITGPRSDPAARKK